MGSAKKRDRPGKPVVHPKVVNTDTGEIFDTYTEAAKSVDGQRQGVKRCCEMTQSHHKGQHFQFIDIQED